MMPTYEYSCSKCGRFEVEQRIVEDPLSSCPTCGGPVTRLISRNVNFIFKGPGFYVTDNRKSKSDDGTGDSRKNGESAKDSAAVSADD